jgi:hypothetical protein
MTHALEQVIYFHRLYTESKWPTKRWFRMFTVNIWEEKWWQSMGARNCQKVKTSINRQAQNVFALKAKTKTNFEQKNGLIRCAKLEWKKKSEIKLYGVLFNFGPALNAMNCQNYEMGEKREEERAIRRTTSDQTAQQQTY